MIATLKRSRATSSEDKEQRRVALREAALSLFDEVPFAAVRMADVAERAKLAKGTVFLYYPTKEALFLDLLEVRLFAWLDGVEAELDAGRGPFTVARFARVVRYAIAADPTLVRLLLLLSGVIEQNVDVDAVIAFKQRLAARVGSMGDSLERRLAFLAPGEGARILLRVHALVVGLYPMSASSVGAHSVLRPELGILVVPFEEELESCLLALLRGMERAES